ncbi:hypothetical protein Ancab_013033 [Ancistrocladus abbreviatus]
MVLTPQLSPHGRGFGTVRCLSSAQAKAKAVRLSNGRSCAFGEMKRAGALVLQVRTVLVGQPQAQALHGIMDSLKWVENETRHFGLTFVG